MSNYNSLKATINANIRANGNQQITGPVLNSVLQAMVDTIGAGYQYVGIANPSMNPNSPDNKVFYVATIPGTYTNFGGIIVNDGEVAILRWDTAWTKDFTGMATAAALLDVQSEIAETTTRQLPVNRIRGLKLRSGGITSDSNAFELCYFPATAGVTYNIRFGNTPGPIRFAYSTSVPAAGVSVTNYITSAQSEGNRMRTPSTDCYIIVACDTGFVAGDPIVLVNKDSGVGYDVLNLKSQVATLETNVGDLQTTIASIATYNETFPLVGYQIADGTDPRYPAGSVIHLGGTNVITSQLVPTDNIARLRYALLMTSRTRGLAIAFYDENQEYISGLKSESIAEVEMLPSAFPSGCAFIRFSSVSDSQTNPAVTAYPNKDLLSAENDITALERMINEGGSTPLDIYWAACGDSITHGSHLPLLPDDPYNPIDDYVDKGYANATSGARPCYAYFFSKKERMQWANYGYGGTILGDYIPKYLGANNYLYPFIDTRITQFKADIPWNYISILFGFNDDAYGPIYQKDKWLSATYGQDIGYPVYASQVGASGFATAEQKAACDALGDDYFYDAFIGTINDAGRDTFYGAYNYALDYLLKHYPNAKIIIMCPFVAEVANCQKLRAAVIALAQKFGVTYFDFSDLAWWYYTINQNNTPFRNPDRADGRWVKANGETTPPTIDGFNLARFCTDSVHPTLVGYQWIADPIGTTMLEK